MYEGKLSQSSEDIEPRYLWLGLSLASSQLTAVQEPVQPKLPLEKPPASQALHAVEATLL